MFIILFLHVVVSGLLSSFSWLRDSVDLLWHVLVLAQSSGFILTLSLNGSLI